MQRHDSLRAHGLLHRLSPFLRLSVVEQRLTDQSIRGDDQGADAPQPEAKGREEESAIQQRQETLCCRLSPTLVQ